MVTAMDSDNEGALLLLEGYPTSDVSDLVRDRCDNEMARDVGELKTFSLF